MDTKEEILIMNQVLSTILTVIMAIMGGGATLFMLVALPVTLVWKFYRKLKYGYKMTD